MNAFKEYRPVSVGGEVGDSVWREGRMFWIALSVWSVYYYTLWFVFFCLVLSVTIELLGDCTKSKKVASHISLIIYIGMPSKGYYITLNQVGGGEGWTSLQSLAREEAYCRMQLV